MIEGWQLFGGALWFIEITMIIYIAWIVTKNDKK